MCHTTVAQGDQPRMWLVPTEPLWHGNFHSLRVPVSFTSISRPKVSNAVAAPSSYVIMHYRMTCCDL